VGCNSFKGGVTYKGRTSLKYMSMYGHTHTVEKAILYKGWIVMRTGGDK